MIDLTNNPVLTQFDGTTEDQMIEIIEKMRSSPIIILSIRTMAKIKKLPSEWIDTLLGDSIPPAVAARMITLYRLHSGEGESGLVAAMRDDPLVSSAFPNLRGSEATGSGLEAPVGLDT